MGLPKPYSAFRELLLEAWRLGAKELNFSVRLEKYNEEDGVNRWSVRARLEDHVPHLAQGRSGEEALRELVRFLEMRR